MTRRRFPKPLPEGGCIGLIAPASPIFEAEKRDAAVRLLQDMGYTVRRGESVDALDCCFSGSDALRARDVTQMFLDDSVDAIVCLRGGYGCARLLSLIPWNEVARHPKLLVGFSDITALHAALWKHCGFVTVHGPMPGSTHFGDVPTGLGEDRQRLQWLKAMSGTPDPLFVNPDGDALHAHGHKTVEGLLIGGNLTVLVSLLGTACEPDWDGKLLLLEDINEKPYRIDSMMQQLQQHGVFDRIRGLILGDYTDCFTDGNERELSRERVFLQHLPDALPVLWNLHVGHDAVRGTLLTNARYRLNPKAATLTLLESPYTHA